LELGFAERAIAFARETRQKTNIEFKVADFEEKNLEDESIDLAFSNMSFQWGISLAQILKMIYEALKMKGLLVFSLPLENNFPEMRREHKNNFRSKDEIEALLKKRGFEILSTHSECCVESFGSPLMCLRSLKKTGATVLLNAHSQRAYPSKKGETIFVEPLNRTLTYHVGFFVVRKT